MLEEVATAVVEASPGPRRAAMKTRTRGHVDRGSLGRAHGPAVFLSVRHQGVHLAHLGLEVKNFGPQVAS